MIRVNTRIDESGFREVRLPNSVGLAIHDGDISVNGHADRFPNSHGLAGWLSATKRSSLGIFGLKDDAHAGGNKSASLTEE